MKKDTKLTKALRKILIVILILFGFQLSPSQNAKTFSGAVSHSNFRKVARIVHKIVKKNRRGKKNFKGPGSGYDGNLSPCLDSIVSWLKKRDGVEDACWDKCQNKIGIYPGHSTVGVKLRTKKGIVEKCFLIQEGTTGQVNFFGWRPKLFRSKKILVYQKMYERKNFVEEQKKNCLNELTK